MQYAVRHAVMKDLPCIEAIYCSARTFMAENGNPTQWGNSYPSRDLLCRDIEKNALYVVVKDDEIHGVFFFILGEDPTYTRIYDGVWHSNQSYGTIHRIAGDGTGGILHTAVEFAKTKTDYLRIDTHADNHVMQAALKKQGFLRCGTIYVEDGTARIAYDYKV